MGRPSGDDFVFFFTGHQPSCQRGPFLGFVLTPCPVLFFSCFSATPQFHSPVIFSGIRFPVSSHQVGPSGEIVGSTHFLFCLCISPTSIRVTPRRLSHRVIFGVIRRFDFIHSFSSCSLFERWGQYIDVFLPSLVLIPSRAPQKSRTPKKAYSRHYDVFQASSDLRHKVIQIFSPL